MDIKEKISNLSSYVHGFREILRFSRYEKKGKIQVQGYFRPHTISYIHE